MRIVVVSDSYLRGGELTSAVRNVPGASVVAEVDSWVAASAYCDNGTADAVVVGAGAICDQAADLEDMLDLCVARSAWALKDSTQLHHWQTPWKLSLEQSP